MHEKEVSIMLRQTTKREVKSTNMAPITRQHIQIDPAALQFVIQAATEAYSDPLLAALREPLCNAFDAYTLKGTTGRVFIHVPSRQFPTFSVRDEAGGLSRELFEQRLCNIGASGNCVSLQTIGGFGFGSVAPMAYAARFLVINRFEGVKYTYEFGRNEDDEFVVDLIDESDAEVNIPAGIEVQVPIATGDLKLASEKLQYLFEYASKVDLEFWDRDEEGSINPAEFFRQPPAAYKTGVIDVDMQREGKTSQFEWKLCPSAKHGTAVMGPLQYRIDWGSIGFAGTDLGYLDKMHLKADIGTLPLAPSRETIKMSPRTKDILRGVGKFFVSDEFKKSLYDTAGGNDWLTQAWLEATVLHMNEKTWCRGEAFEEHLRKNVLKIDAVTWTNGTRHEAYLGK